MRDADGEPGRSEDRVGDGREGGTEAIGGVHKWLMPCNWKFPAETFSGDRYHGVSHRSVDMVGIGPSGKGRRDMQERNEAQKKIMGILEPLVNGKKDPH